jgi:TldD protein
VLEQQAMLDAARRAVEAARAAGGSYADARLVTREHETTLVRNEELEGVDRSLSEGVGIRVLVDGHWGFAATARSEPEEIERTAHLAVEIARASSRLPGEPVRLAEVEPVVDTWATPIREDPFVVPLSDKLEMLMEASRRLRLAPGVSFGEASLDLFRQHSAFASSEGAAIQQTLVHSGAGIEATAIGEGEIQRRSFPNSFRGHFSAAGYEHIRSLQLLDAAERVGREAAELLAAPE